jgi:hypothetical protein
MLTTVALQTNPQSRTIYQPKPEPPSSSVQIPKLDISLVVLITLLGGLLWKSVLEPYFERLRVSLQYTKEQDARIRDCLSAIRVRSHADRAFLCQFVCAGKTVAGQPAYTMMITHEVDAVNSTKAMPFGANSNFTCVDFIIQSLLATPFRKRNIDDIDDDEYKAYLYNLGVHYIIYKLLTMKKEPIGFIVLHYNNRASLEHWEKFQEKDIESEAQQIIYILHNSNSLWQIIWQSWR